uniref:G-protein coupled receptors family 2 profile 2 domain-containing protein n=1 Tax=Heliothis virescens TaxID=7102 RepID=A0A2A4J442_HELVI
MVKSVLLNVLLVLATSVNAIYFVEDYQRVQSSRFEKFINKCCSLDRYVGRKRTCVEYNETQTFSSIKVYDKALNSTGKSLQNVFSLTTKKFQNETFRKNALDITLMNFNIYLTESGILTLEVPNAYHRWFAVPQGDYCVDYHVADPDHITPKFWAILPDEEFIASSLYTTCATFISCIFLLLVLIVYILLPEFHNLVGLMIMAMIGNLFIAFLLMYIIQIKELTEESCIGFTMASYFFLLASFFWINVISFDICRTFWWVKNLPLRRKEDRSDLVMYCIYAWGMPLLMTIGLGVLNSVDMRDRPWFVTPRIPEYGCFLHGGVKLLYLYCPMLILTGCNWIFYGITVYNIYMTRRAVSGHSDYGRKSTVLIFRKLSILMGLNWVLEFLNYMYPSLKLWYLSDTYNLLIGLAFFIMFVCKKKIFRQLYERYWTNENYTRPTFFRYLRRCMPINTNIALRSIRSI